jgi:hypothetical protein
LSGHNGCASHCSGNVTESGAQVMDARYSTRQRPPPAGCSTLVLFCLVPGVFLSGRGSCQRRGQQLAHGRDNRVKRVSARHAKGFAHGTRAPVVGATRLAGFFHALELSMFQSDGAAVSP